MSEAAGGPFSPVTQMVLRVPLDLKAWIEAVADERRLSAFITRILRREMIADQQRRREQQEPIEAAIVMTITTQPRSSRRSWLIRCECREIARKVKVSPTMVGSAPAEMSGPRVQSGQRDDRPKQAIIVRGRTIPRSPRN